LAPAAVGRWFTSDTEPVAVISHAVWRNRFGGSANVLGRRIGSEAQSYTIVGVAPRAFTGIFAPYRTDIWVPMRTRPRLAAMLDNRSRRVVMVFGRLRPDAMPGQASAELNGIAAQLVAEHGASAEPLPPIVAEPIRGIPNPGAAACQPERIAAHGGRRFWSSRERRHLLDAGPSATASCRMTRARRQDPVWHVS
jgi:hypothetical protein